MSLIQMTALSLAECNYRRSSAASQLQLTLLDNEVHRYVALTTRWCKCNSPLVQIAARWLKLVLFGICSACATLQLATESRGRIADVRRPVISPISIHSSDTTMIFIPEIFLLLVLATYCLWLSGDCWLLNNFDNTSENSRSCKLCRICVYVDLQGLHHRLQYILMAF